MARFHGRDFQCPALLGEPDLRRLRRPGTRPRRSTTSPWTGGTATPRRATASRRAGWTPNVRNAVVLTGDVHRNWANDVKVDYKDPASPVVGSELVCTSITSTGNGSGSTTDRDDGLEPAPEDLQRQPRLREHHHHQGRAHRGLPTLDYVTTPGPVSTKASFAIQDGVPGLQARG